MDFKITKMLSNPLTGVVEQVDYIAQGNQGQSIGSLALESPEEALFIPFSELTKEIVQEWVENKGVYDPKQLDKEDTLVSTAIPWE